MVSKNQNHWQGTGNLTRDPELRKTTKGNAVVDMRIGVNYEYLNDKKELIVESCFVDVEMFGTKAVACAEQLKQGSPVFVEGRLRLDKWHDSKTREPRTKLMVRANNIEFLDPANKAQWPKESTVVTPEIMPEKPMSVEVPLAVITNQQQG